MKKVQSRFGLFASVLAVIALLASVAWAQDAPTIVEVVGKVTDPSGNPVAKATVEALETNVSAVLTDASGGYRFYLVGQQKPFRVKISKDGYIEQSSDLISPQPSVKHEIVLQPRNIPPKLTVTMGSFTANKSMSGKVEGLHPGEEAKYKVFVYVLSDKWYLHPEVSDEAGMGFAVIAADGSWTIRTVKHSDSSPIKLALLVVPIDCEPKPTVEVRHDDAEGSLKSAFPDIVASDFRKAPKGL